MILSKTLTSCSNQVNHQQRNCSNKSKNFTTTPRPFLVSKRILRWSSRKIFFKKPRSAGSKVHSLRMWSTVSSWPYLQSWFPSLMYLIWKYFPKRNFGYSNINYSQIFSKPFSPELRCLYNQCECYTYWSTIFHNKRW